VKKIGSILLTLSLVCFLGGIVGCPAAAPKKGPTPPPAGDAKKPDEKKADEKKADDKKK
jgi:hypothetical protein